MKKIQKSHPILLTFCGIILALFIFSIIAPEWRSEVTEIDLNSGRMRKSFYFFSKQTKQEVFETRLSRMLVELGIPIDPNPDWYTRLGYGYYGLNKVNFHPMPVPIDCEHDFIVKTLEEYDFSREFKTNQVKELMLFLKGKCKEEDKYNLMMDEIMDELENIDYQVPK